MLDFLNKRWIIHNLKYIVRIKVLSQYRTQKCTTYTKISVKRVFFKLHTKLKKWHVFIEKNLVMLDYSNIKRAYTVIYNLLLFKKKKRVMQWLFSKGLNSIPYYSSYMECQVSWILLHFNDSKWILNNNNNLLSHTLNL